jgi:hypothetical protein
LAVYAFLGKMCTVETIKWDEWDVKNKTDMNISALAYLITGKCREEIEKFLLEKRKELTDP